MNTRRKVIQPKAVKPSTQWHIMHEAYHTMFIPKSHEHVEYWYNMGATGAQRDLFRQVCAEIYQQDPNKPDPTYRAAYTEIVQLEEARLLVKNYTIVLTPEGQAKARVWILHEANRRRRDHFRDVFTGCQTVFLSKSVMKTDYVAPEANAYPTDKVFYQCSVDWGSLKGRQNAQALQQLKQTANTSSVVQRPSVIATNTSGKPRFTKPKSQFDGVSMLASLGYGDMPVEDAARELRARRDAHQEGERYYIDTDGSTVYKAGATHKLAGPPPGPGIFTTITDEPIAEWKVKICE